MIPSGWRASWMAPTPKRIAGMNGSRVPRRAEPGRHAGGQPEPAGQELGEQCERQPGDERPGWPADPNSTTLDSHSKPTVAGVEPLVTLLLNDASITPPRPAMAAERAKTSSLVRTGDTPDVAAAGSEARVANMARPVGDRFRLWIPSMTSPMMASRTNAMVRLSLRLNAPRAGRCTTQPAVPWRSQFHWNSTLSPRKARARVARARGRPPRRRAGRAMMMPMTTETATPSRRAGRNGQP